MSILSLRGSSQYRRTLTLLDLELSDFSNLAPRRLCLVDLVTKLLDREADVSVADVEEAIEQDWTDDSEGAEELNEEAFKR